MAETIPTHEPAGFVVGDSVKWKIRTVVNGEHKDPADSWVLTYNLVSPSAQFSFAGSDNGDGYHLIDLAPSTTDGYASGVYHYQASIALGAARHVVSVGEICLEPDFGSLDSHDARQWAVRVLDALEATIEGKATRDQLSYTIQGRSLSRMSWGELMSARQQLQREVNSLRQAESIAKGRGHSGIVRTRI